MAKRQFQGKVISNKMDKTIVVKVERLKIHPLYKKRYRTHKKYKVHDQDNKANTGDMVLFEECRPLSKHKKWRFIKIM